MLGVPVVAVAAAEGVVAMMVVAVVVGLRFRMGWWQAGFLCSLIVTVLLTVILGAAVVIHDGTCFLSIGLEDSSHTRSDQLGSLES